METVFEVGEFDNVAFIVETSLFMTPRVVVSCFGVVSELSAGVNGDVLSVALLVVPSGGVPPVVLLRFVTDTVPGVVADAFVVDVSASDGVKLF